VEGGATRRGTFDPNLEEELMVKNLVEKEVGSDLMLYDPELDEVHILNATAGMVYRLHKAGKPVPDIETELSRAFRVQGSEAVVEDVRACLASLRQKGLLE
jgi:hypothetical protein